MVVALSTTILEASCCPALIRHLQRADGHAGSGLWDSLRAGRHLPAGVRLPVVFVICWLPYHLTLLLLTSTAPHISSCYLATCSASSTTSH